MIRNLEKKTFTDFGGGRVTSENQLTVPENCLTVSNNILVHSGAPQPIEGYTLNRQIAQLVKVQRLYQYERQADKKNFLIVSGINANGKASVIVGDMDIPGNEVELANAEIDGDYDFVTNVHSLYASNGFAMKKMIDVGGNNIWEPVGLQIPPQPPTMETGNGRLNLSLGRRHVYCEVRKWTDVTGTERFKISAPSDFSAHTGKLGLSVNDAAINNGSFQLTSATAVFVPGDVGTTVIISGAGPNGGNLETTITAYTNATTVQLAVAASTTVAGALLKYRNKAVTLGGMVKFNPETTHFWIFATTDTLIDATDSYYFAAEITSDQNSWVDQIDDADLDTTQKAPFDNYPPPQNSKIILDYQGRIALVFDDKVQLSALDETPLGVALDSYPKTLEFQIPVGSKKLVGAIVFNTALLVGTEDVWFRIQYNRSTGTWTKTDNVVSPGPVSRKAIKVIHGKLVWEGRDKKTWSWTGIDGEDALPANNAILPHSSNPDQLDATGVSENYIDDSELVWFTRDTFDFAILAVASRNSVAGEKDWLQMWDLTPIIGSRVVQGYVQQPALTDFFPYDEISTIAAVKMNGQYFLLMGSATDGSIFRWPDGKKFNGQTIKNASFVTGLLKVDDGKIRNRFVRFMTSIKNACDKLDVQIGSFNGSDRQARMIPVDRVTMSPDLVSQDSTVAIADLRQEGLAVSQFLKIAVTFPEPDADFIMDAIQVWFSKLKGA